MPRLGNALSVPFRRPAWPSRHSHQSRAAPPAAPLIERPINQNLVGSNPRYSMYIPLQRAKQNVNGIVVKNRSSIDGLLNWEVKSAGSFGECHGVGMGMTRLPGSNQKKSAVATPHWRAH